MVLLHDCKDIPSIGICNGLAYFLTPTQNKRYIPKIISEWILISPTTTNFAPFEKFLVLSHKGPGTLYPSVKIKNPKKTLYIMRGDTDQA